MGGSMPSTVQQGAGMGNSAGSAPGGNAIAQAPMSGQPQPPNPAMIANTPAHPPQGFSDPTQGGDFLSKLFASNQPMQAPQTPQLMQPGYQPNPVPPNQQPQLQPPILPTQQQAAAATQARMMARTPPSPVIANGPTVPKKPEFYHNGGSNR